MENRYSHARQDENGSVKKVIVPVLLTIAVILLGILLIWGGISIYKYYKNKNPIALFSKDDIDPYAGYYIKDDSRNDGTPISGVAIPGFSEVKIPAGMTNVSMLFLNPEANANKYYLQFTLKLKDSGEALYSSKLVPPGQCVENIKLKRALNVGNYTAIVDVQPFRMDTLEETNNAEMITTLVVK